MPNNAKISIIGNLTRDPQTRQAGSSNVASFSVAVNTMNKKGDGAYESNFYDVSAFGKLGEYLMQHLQKGTQVWVNGDFTASEYTNKDGVVYINLGFYAEYFMDDPSAIYYNTPSPSLYLIYHSSTPDSLEITSEKEVIDNCGVKIISYNYAEPIKNTFNEQLSFGRFEPSIN